MGCCLCIFAKLLSVDFFCSSLEKAFKMPVVAGGGNEEIPGSLGFYNFQLEMGQLSLCPPTFTYSPPQPVWLINVDRFNELVKCSKTIQLCVCVCGCRVGGESWGWKGNICVPRTDSVIGSDCSSFLCHPHPPSHPPPPLQPSKPHRHGIKYGELFMRPPLSGS